MTRSTAPRVVVVGSCIMDVCMAVPRLPRVGETLVADGMRLAPGGKGANQAIFVSRLGVRSQLISCVGDDPFGRAFGELLRAEGVDAGLLVTDPEAPTGVGVPLILGGSANAIVVAPGAAMRLPAEVVRRGRRGIAAARALLLQLEVPAPAVQEAADLARAAQVEVFLNAAPVAAGAARLAAGADVLIVNESEAEELSGLPVGARLDPAVRAARALHELGPPTVVLTLGERGALLSRGGEPLFVPGFRVAAVDPTGAGDAFCAGLVAARCGGSDWPAAVALANACGALAATALGATAGLRDRAAAEALVGDGPRWIEPE